MGCKTRQRLRQAGRPRSSGASVRSRAAAVTGLARAILHASPSWECVATGLARRAMLTAIRRGVAARHAPILHSIGVTPSNAIRSLVPSTVRYIHGDTGRRAMLRAARAARHARGVLYMANMVARHV